ncbi:MAG: hypothetical protein H7A37_01710 [Chlamydiales bacterium]|nr:hypothetical protein [Chlamydiia bacterium]MCP5507005.1 hypothetical protein [Chlamydiales bacterium]
MTVAGNDPKDNPSRALYTDFEQLMHFKPGLDEMHFQAGIIPQHLMDSIDFTQTPMGFVGRNPTDATHPTLQQPIFSLRGSIQEPVEAETTWQEVQQELVDSLPPDYQTWFQEQQALPANERSEAFTAFNEMLTFVAKGKVWLARVAQPFAEGSTAADNIQRNLGIAAQALYGAILHVETLLTMGRGFLEDTGANHENFDAKMNYLNQLEGLMDTFTALQETAGSGPLDDSARGQVGELTRQITNMSMQFQAVSIGNELQIIGPMLNVLQTVASSYLLDQELQAIYIGMTLASVGINSADSELGIVGDALSETQRGLVEWVLQILVPNFNEAEQDLASNLTNAGLLTVLVAALGAYDGSETAAESEAYE